MCAATSHPERLGRYEIVETLPRGRMVEIFRGYDSSNQRVVSLKTIPIERLKKYGPDALSIFQNEAAAAAKLHHPGIVEVYEYGQDHGHAFIATEYVPGGSLKEQTRVSVADAASLLVQLLAVLEYAHAGGVLHLEIEPSNLLLTASGQLRVKSFGVARLEPAQSSFMSPEQLMGWPPDERSDIFSAGIVFYELLTGTTPFPGPAESLMARVCDHRQKETPVSKVNHDVPPSFDEVSAKALAKAVYDRYSTARLFSDAITGAFRARFNSPVSPFASPEAIRILAGQEGSPAGDSASGASKDTNPPAIENRFKWDDSTLRLLEREAAVYIGPLAEMVVRDAAAKTGDPDQLRSLVAKSLHTDLERQTFLARIAKARSVGGVDQAEMADRGRREDSSSVQIGVPTSPSAIKTAGPAEGKMRPPLEPQPPLRSLPRPEIPPQLETPPREVRAGENRSKPAADQGSPEVVRKDNSTATLSSYLKDAPATVENIVRVFINCLDAVITLHTGNQKNVALAPQSFCFDKMGKVSIVRPGPESLQNEGIAMGNPRYAAPEMFADKGGSDNKAIAEAHIYVLGFMFYEILLGKVIFDKTFANQRTDLDWLRWHSNLESKAPPVKSLLTDCPPALSDLLDTMIEKRIEKRSADLSALRAGFVAVANRANRTVVILNPAFPPVSAVKAAPPKQKTPGKTNALLMFIWIFVGTVSLLFVGFLIYILKNH
jgi:serine/threonine protein kinase